MWVVISTSSIITPNFRKLPLNNYSSLIQSSGYLVTSSNSHFSNIFCSLVLGDPFIGWNLLFNFPHARKAHPLSNSLVVDYSKICKHTVSYCTKTRSLYAFLFSCLRIASSLFFSSSFSARVFTVPLRMILQPSHPSIAKNFPDHIRHLSLSPLKGVILVLFSSVVLDLPWWWSLVSPEITSKYVGGICETLLF